MSRARDIANLVDSNGDIVAGALDNISVTPTAISDQSNTSTGYFDLPAGTTAQRPSPNEGQIRFNSTVGVAEYYNGTQWISIDQPPVVSSISPTQVTTANTNITITGSNFSSGATVKFVGNDGTEYSSPSVTRNSASELVAQTPATALLATNEPYDILVTNASGLTGRLDDVLDAGSAPAWSTAAGNIATIWDEGDNYSPIATVSATDADGQGVTYTETGSVLSNAGLSLNSSNGQITGNPNDVTNQETKTFTISASDGVNTTNRTFNIVINPMDALCWYKSENLSDTGSTISWANSGSLGSAENLTMFGDYNSMGVTASDASYGNQKTLEKHDGGVRGGLSTPTGINRSAGNPFTLIAVMHQDTNSSDPYGESAFGWSSDLGSNTGDWMFDTNADHTWGGSYGEFRTANGGTVGTPHIIMWRWAGGSNGAWDLRRMALTSSGFYTQGSGNAGDQLGGGYERLQLLDNYDSGAGGSHHFDGKIAEFVWIGASISDTHANYWRDYLKEKFT